jgi:ribonuclease P protein component
MQTPHLDVRYAASALVQPRVGLIVPKHKHSAVDRNRLRRRLREIIRVQLLPSVRQGDALIRAKLDAYEVSFSTLRTEVETISQWISEISLR